MDDMQEFNKTTNSISAVNLLLSRQEQNLIIFVNFYKYLYGKLLFILNFNNFK